MPGQKGEREMSDFWMDSNVQRGLIAILIILWFISAFVVMCKIGDIMQENKIMKEIKEGKEKKNRVEKC